MAKIIFMLLLIAIGVFAARRFLSGGAAMSADEARRLLGVSADADADAINAAHRQLIAKVHPDSGGNNELASRVNQARDVLLRHLKN